MPHISREQLLTCLEEDWRNYPVRFLRLGAAAQKDFLQIQGYETFGGLLGHITAWWQEGVSSIQKIRREPDVKFADYDVDAFNARAVKKWAGINEGEGIQRFETQRKTMLELINTLADAELDLKRINERLFLEIIEHWEEHKLD